GAVYRDPVAFADGFRTAALIGSGMLVLGGLLSAVGIRNSPDEPETEHCYSCPLDGPHLETVQPARTPRTT
ncbi:MAG TPA: hypothetical protein VLM05_16460, partial [Mycobacteriales bacterium]|nr:hypothetical protein [Mycobacteriales bacterium]